MDKNYWAQFTRKRASRRRGLAGSAAVIAGALFLAACGDDDDAGGASAGAGTPSATGSSTSTGNVGGAATTGSTGDSTAGGGPTVFTSTEPEEPVKKGGQWVQSSTEPINFDSFAQATAVVPENVASYMLGRLMTYKVAPGLDPNLFEVEPDLASSYEASGDGLTYTFKIREGVTWHDVAPVSGRDFDAQDVLASYERFKSLAPQYASAFEGVVDDVSAPDESTVVFRLTKRNVNFINLVTQAQYLLLYPREAGDGYDPKSTIIGTGPWMMDKYNPSVDFVFARNPNYYREGLPNMDSVRTVFITETAQVLAQFAAGNFYDFEPDLAGDFKDLLDRRPDLRILGRSEANRPGSVSFGRGDDPQYFLDDRVRKAVSLALDRDTILQVVANTGEFAAIGLEKTYHLQNFVPYALRKWWTDPRARRWANRLSGLNTTSRSRSSCSRPLATPTASIPSGTSTTGAA